MDLRSLVERLSASLVHRGPNDSGAWGDAQHGLAMGHRRLAVLDLSSQGRQPMQSASGRYLIVYNGEIYNCQEMRADLETSEARLRRWRGHSDTEVLIEAISQWGVEGAASRCNGMFAFAVWDREQRVLTLGRDRLGEKPLYYGRFGSTFLFGSELKALIRHPNFVSTLDMSAVSSFLRYGYVPGPLSIYRGIQKLPPGTLLSVPAPEADIRPVAYWSLSTAVQAGSRNIFSGSPVEASNALDALLRDAVARRMVADVPIGAFLSGGIDSACVVAMMQAQATQPVKTFTIGLEQEDHSEAQQARRTAARLGTEHTEFTIAPSDAQAVIPLLPTMYDEPFADPSQIPTWCVANMTRAHVTVALSGDGGDELFGGYQRYITMQSLWPKTRLLPEAVRRGLAGVISRWPVERWDRALSSSARFLPYTPRRRSPGEKLHDFADALSAGNVDEFHEYVVARWHGELLEPSVRIAIRRGGDRRGWPEFREPAEAMMFVDTVTYLPDDILVKLDRATMAVSLEARVPLLDHRIVEFAWSLPLAMKISGGCGKRILRDVLRRYIPADHVVGQKRGFVIPLADWLRGPLRDWAEALLDRKRLRQDGMLNPEPIHSRWRQHVDGVRDWHESLWSVLMLQAWLDAYRAHH